MPWGTQQNALHISERSMQNAVPYGEQLGFSIGICCAASLLLRSPRHPSQHLNVASEVAPRLQADEAGLCLL